MRSPVEARQPSGGWGARKAIKSFVFLRKFENAQPQVFDHRIRDAVNHASNHFSLRIHRLNQLSKENEKKPAWP